MNHHEMIQQRLTILHRAGCDLSCLENSNGIFFTSRDGRVSRAEFFVARYPDWPACVKDAWEWLDNYTEVLRPSPAAFVAFDDIKEGQVCVGYVALCLTDEGRPSASHRLFPPTEEGKAAAFRHAEQIDRGRQPAVFALRQS